MKSLRLPILLAIVLVLLTAPLAHGELDPRVLPPTTPIQGLTYGEWMAKWWTFMLTIPASRNPILGAAGPQCAVERVGNVALVAAPSTLGAGVVIDCPVPADAMLYVEVLGSECSTLEPPPFSGTNEAELRACALGFQPEAMIAAIDGVAVPNLDQYIVTSPLFAFTVPDDNIFGVAPGERGQSIGHGAYLMLAPLTPGEHTLHTGGKYVSPVDFTADRTLKLTVAHRLALPLIRKAAP